MGKMNKWKLFTPLVIFMVAVTINISGCSTVASKTQSTPSAQDQNNTSKQSTNKQKSEKTSNEIQSKVGPGPLTKENEQSVAQTEKLKPCSTNINQAKDVKFIQDKALDQVIALSAIGKRAIIQRADGLDSWSSGIKSYGINPSSLENSLEKIPNKYYLITLIGYKVTRVEFYTEDNSFKVYLDQEAGLYNAGIPITEYAKANKKITLKYFSGDTEIK